jgi:hypothetical protein
MRRGFGSYSAGLAGLLLLIALPAAADITVIGRYSLANGDTLTRASYYTRQRIRTTLPNGDEIIYDHAAKRIALVDHAARRYWEGPLSKADSIAARIRSERAQAFMANATPEMKARVSEIYASLTDSVRTEMTEETRKISSYPCTKWVLTAGRYLRQERWVARSLALPDFGPEVEKVALVTMMDPLGRGLMKLVLQSRATDGLPLAAHMRFSTLSADGEMSWEAVRVVSGSIDKQAWVVPAGYERWNPPAADGK